MSKKLGKYFAAFDYTDKTLIVLSATNGGITIISFASEIYIATASASFTLCVFFDYRYCNETFKHKKK